MASSENTVFPSPSDDLEMDKAAAVARQAFRFFWREMAWEQRRIIPGLALSAVKGAFKDPPELADQASDGPDIEHMWLLDIDFDGRSVSGTLINSPTSLQSIHEGDRVSLTGKQISDWMYVMGDHVYGGFTIDLLRSRMNGRERKEHDQAWGQNFGDVGIVNVVPPEYIGGKPSRAGLFSRFGKRKSQPQDYALAAETEHPMSVNMRESLQEGLSENPMLVHEADDRGFTLLHQLSLAGSLDGVDVCLQCGADPEKPADNGMTPYKLAKALGWKKVMARLQQALAE